MAEFDPYLKWLGIRDPQRPPNHYRLLGLDLFEADVEVIAMAEMRQLAHIRNFESGPHSEAAKKLLIEIEIAKHCLTDPNEKQTYDQRLSIELGQSSQEPSFQFQGSNEDHPSPIESISISVDGEPLIEPIDQRLFDNIESPGDIQPKPATKSKPVNVRAQRREEQRRASRQKKGSGWVTQMVGVVGGGILAVVVAGWIINSGYLERFRPGSKEANETFAEKREIHFSQPQPSKRTPSANKRPTPPPIKQPGRKGAVTNRTPNPDSRLAPWKEPRWPEVPSQLSNPLSTKDRLFQKTRVAIAQRQFAEARKEWRKIKDEAAKIDSAASLGMLATKAERFWKDVARTASKLKVGDKIMFRQKAVEVVNKLKGEIKLKHNQNTETFPLDHLLLDRDLAKGLASKTGYDRTLTEKYLNLDFVHASFSSGSDTFFEPTRRPNSNTNNRNSAATGQPQPNRISVPSLAEVNALLPRIKQLFPKAYQRGLSLRDHSKQLAEMIDYADQSDDTIESYALLQQVVILSGKAGSIEPGYDALCKLEETFEIDRWTEFAVLTKEVAGNLKNMDQATRLQDRLETLVAESVRVREFSLAVTFAEQARDNAKRKLNSREKTADAAATVDYIEKMATLQSRGKRALETLKLKPTDASANTHAGLYLCLLMGDYPAGATRLAKSNRSLLKNIGEAEAKSKRTNLSEIEIATLWAQYAKGQKDFSRFAAYRRAKHWLELAYKRTDDGLQKRDLKNKLDQVKATLENDPLDALRLMEGAETKR